MDCELSGIWRGMMRDKKDGWIDEMLTRWISYSTYSTSC